MSQDPPLGASRSAALPRRQFLAAVGTATAGAAFLQFLRVPAAFADLAPPTTTAIPTLGVADANGWQLLPGFTSRVVASSGVDVPGGDTHWHQLPDGGAVFPRADGSGWSYVSNAERSNGQGGAKALHFDADGLVIGSSVVLAGTSRNCSGGATPWGTWLSCEEVVGGRVWECDPSGAAPGVKRPAMGAAVFESAACDTVNEVVYLTEDVQNAGFFRFTPDVWEDLSAGRLDVLTRVDDVLVWQEVPDTDPTDAADVPMRAQVPGTVRFRGAEGVWMDGVAAVFSTKFDNRVWSYHPEQNTLHVVYDFNATDTPVLSGVDNVTGFPGGGVLVAEDQGNMELVYCARDGRAAPVARLTGVEGSELTGPAFDPTGTRLYVSSQRNPGTTYEIAGPWGEVAMGTPPHLGTVDVDRWFDVAGTTLQSIPDGTPPATSERLAMPNGVKVGRAGDNHGTRLRFRFTAPTDDLYHFWIRSDDSGVLLMNKTGQDAAGAVQVANVPAWTAGYQWRKYPEQRSGPIPLQGGRQYHLTAMAKDGAGGDHLSVGYSVGDDDPVQIPPSLIRPAVETAGPWLAPPAPVAENAGTVSLDEWVDVVGASMTSVPEGQLPDVTTTYDLYRGLQTPSNRGDQYAYRVRALVRPPTSGNWTFWIACDNRGVLLLDPTGADPTAAVPICNATYGPQRTFLQQPAAQSAVFALEGGVDYYLEALLKEYTGGDHLSVAWQQNGQDRPTVIPGEALSATELGAGGWRTPAV